MNRLQKTISALLAGMPFFLLIVALGLFPAFATTIEKIIAIVNEKAITSSDLDAAIRQFGPELQKAKGLSGAALQKEVLNSLIENLLVDEEIEKTKIVVEPHEIDSYTEQIMRSAHLTPEQFRAELLKNGRTYEEYKRTIQKQLMRNKFISQKIGPKIAISERELKEYFESHMGDFRSQTSIQLAQITIGFTPTTTPDDFKDIEKLAISIREAAKSTSDFEALAKRFRNDKYPVEGGNLGVVNMKDLQPSMAQAVSNLSPGETAPPVVSNTGIHILKVIDRAKTSSKDFASVRDQVYNQIYDIKLQQFLKGFAQELRRKAHIQVLSLGTTP